MQYFALLLALVSFSTSAAEVKTFSYQLSASNGNMARLDTQGMSLMTSYTYPVVVNLSFGGRREPINYRCNYTQTQSTMWESWGSFDCQGLQNNKRIQFDHHVYNDFDRTESSLKIEGVNYHVSSLSGERDGWEPPTGRYCAYRHDAYGCLIWRRH